MYDKYAHKMTKQEVIDLIADTRDSVSRLDCAVLLSDQLAAIESAMMILRQTDRIIDWLKHAKLMSVDYKVRR